MNETEAPVRVAGGTLDDYVETHPAYAIIGASRYTATPGHALFGSDFLHGTFVRIRIGPSELTRRVSGDWVHGGRTPYIEVDLSEAQWATFVSSMNIGDGVACTAVFREGVGHIPGIKTLTNRRAEFNDEVAETLKDALAALHELRDAAAAGRPSAKDVKGKVDKAITEIEANLPWLAKSFDEHAENTVEKMKIDVNAYMTRMAMQAGLTAIGGDVTILELPEGD